MRQDRVTTSELKARCAQVIERVARHRQPVVIVRRGRPVARLVPVEERPTSLFGCASGCVAIRGDIVAPLDVDWEAVR